MPCPPLPWTSAASTGRPASAARRGGPRSSPRDDYDPRCSCCPLLFGRVSEEIEALAGGRPERGDRPATVYASAYLVALDVQTGVCVHVEHLDGDNAGRGFSLDVLGVDEDVDPDVAHRG